MRIDSYPAGVPCFVDTITDDLAAAQRFYTGLFDWDFVGPGNTPGDPPGQYFVARVSGVDVAGVGRLGGGVTPPPPGWSTHVAVSSVDESADNMRDAGGTIVTEPFDLPPLGGWQWSPIRRGRPCASGRPANVRAPRSSTPHPRGR
jgi:predicted enzyme related to lactoylglutathione lyase